MSVNLEGLSTKELAELITRANQRKKVLAKRKPANQVKAAVAKFLKSTGWSFDELYGRSGQGGAEVPQPANASETWAGRGKQPKWLAAETAKGRRLEDFLIK